MKSQKIRRARKLRRSQTNAESILWRYLRNRKIAYAKFRRQVPLGRYVVDFFCYEKLLIIELDGGQHAVDQSRDARRTEWLESEGYRVVRFWNNDVIENVEGVLLRIRELMEG